MKATEYVVKHAEQEQKLAVLRSAAPLCPYLHLSKGEGRVVLRVSGVGGLILDVTGGSPRSIVHVDLSINEVRELIDWLLETYPAE